MSIGKWSTFVRLNFSSRTWKRHLREAFIEMDQFQKLLNSENFLKTFSTSIMSTVFINTNANSNNSMNSNGQNGALQEIEGKNQSESGNFRKLSVLPQVTEGSTPKWAVLGQSDQSERFNWTVQKDKCGRSCSDKSIWSTRVDDREGLNWTDRYRSDLSWGMKDYGLKKWNWTVFKIKSERSSWLDLNGLRFQSGQSKAMKIGGLKEWKCTVLRNKSVSPKNDRHWTSFEPYDSMTGRNTVS